MLFEKTEKIIRQNQQFEKQLEKKNKLRKTQKLEFISFL